jgi:aminopeptidase N
MKRQTHRLFNNGARALATLGAALALAGCANLGPPPLDPLIGQTALPLSANMQAYHVLQYTLALEVLPESKTIQGSGATRLRALAPLSVVELRLDSRFNVAKVEVDGQPASLQRAGGVLSIPLARPLPAGGEATVTVFYSGAPHVAKRAPWDGGTVWATTPQGQPWVATAVEGEGCDLWWPCKDHFGDKPDAVAMHITVPAGLSAAMNGRLQGMDTLADGRRTFHWLLSVPVSDYNIALNVGPYVRIQEQYTGVNGATIPIEFWALPENAQKARELVNQDLRSQVEFFEKFLGPYPWGGEKMGFVETPHLGMEHQTINAYGKGYKRDINGYDWLMQHELSHEWFGNLVTHKRLNDAWIHEGFAQYMQPAYARWRFGEAAYHHAMYARYLPLKNCAPVVLAGEPSAQDAFSSDIYGKGAWTLHTLRWLVGDEAFWRATRRLLYDTATPWSLPYPLTTRYRSTEDFIAIVNQESGRDWTWLFDVYLREAALPELLSEQTPTQLTLRWKVPANKPFPMPVPVAVNGNLHLLDLSGGSATLALHAGDHVQLDPEMRVLRQLDLIEPCKPPVPKTESAAKK